MSVLDSQSYSYYFSDGKTAAYLQGREYVALETLLNVVPEEDLYYVNFGDASVLKHFARTNVNLDNRKVGCNNSNFANFHTEYQQFNYMVMLLLIAVWRISCCL